MYFFTISENKINDLNNKNCQNIKSGQAAGEPLASGLKAYMD